MPDQETLQHLRDLQAPLKSFRLFAIEHFIREGQGREVLAALDSALSAETDEECRILLNHALATVRQRSATAYAPPDRPSAEIEPAALPPRFAAAQPEERVELIRLIKKAHLLVLAEFAVEAFQRETHPLVARELIRRFCPVWPENRRQVLGKALASEWQTIRFAALEALMAIAPRELTVHLPSFLRHADPRVRSMAVRALAVIDPPEAANHLETLLLGPDPAGRWSALRECSRLPFDLTRPLLLAFLASEADAALLDAAGAIVAANPDPEVPFRLADILAQRPEHVPLLSTMLQTVISALHDSGQLQESRELYRQRIQTYVNHLGANRLVRRVMPGLASTDPALRSEAKATLSRYLSRPAVRETLELLLEQPQPDLTRDAIQEVLAPEKPSAAETMSSEWAASSSETDQVRWLAGRRREDVARLAQVLPRILSDPAVSATVKAVALRAAARCRVADLAPMIRPLLKHADDGVAAAALEYLAAVSPEEIVPVIGKYLKAPRPRLRLAAIRILRSSDPLQAVSALFSLLQTGDAMERSLSLPLLVQFEFSLIRDRLLELVESHKAPELFDDVLALFEANPEVAALYPLFRLARRLGGENASRVDLVRSRVAELLVKTGQISSDALQALETEFPTRVQQDEMKRAAPLPAYALKAMAREEEGLWPVVRSILKQVFVEYGHLLAISLLIGILLHRTFGCAQTPVEVKTRSGAVIQNHVARGEGVLMKLTDFGWTIRMKDDSIWRLSPPPGGFPFLIEGMKVKVTATLYRRDTEGAFQGRCVSVVMTL